MPTLSIVLPCHNEAKAIPQVLRALDASHMELAGDYSGYQVIVVDDSSTDPTPKILAQVPNVEVVRLSRRSGYGAALKAGFRACTGDHIAFLDLDGTYDPADLKPLLKAMRSSGRDFVLGERLSQGAGMPILRGWGNSFFSSLVRKLWGAPVQDACTGFRVFHRRWVPELLALPDQGLNYSLVMTLWMIRNRLAFQELPIRYHHRMGNSKLSVVIDGSRFLWTILGSSLPSYVIGSTNQDIH